MLFLKIQKDVEIMTIEQEIFLLEKFGKLPEVYWID